MISDPLAGMTVDQAADRLGLSDDPRPGSPAAVALAEVSAELERALVKFPSFNSPHEGYAVIREELERELWAHVCDNTGRTPKARYEAIQIAAMAIRYAIDLCDDTETT